MLERMRAIARESVRKKGPPCCVCVLPKATLAAVKQLRSEALPMTAICVALKEDGHAVNVHSMTRHFREHDRS
jgi:hypothetical protein